jgi:uncharacterized protein GlcG (DUF336 family)
MQVNINAGKWHRGRICKRAGPSDKYKNMTAAVKSRAGRPQAVQRNNGIVSCAVPYQTETAFKAAAARRGITVSAYLRDLITRELAETETA